MLKISAADSAKSEYIIWVAMANKDSILSFRMYSEFVDSDFNLLVKTYLSNLWIRLLTNSPMIP